MSAVAGRPSRTTAIVGATLIDGSGRPAVAGSTVVMRDGRIVQAGPTGSVTPDADAAVIDAAGKWIMPGIIDTNVHLTVFGQNMGAGYETLVRYAPLNDRLAIESAQLHLRHGVTTVRDSYGVLPSLVAARSVIESGSVIGARILAAGNIVGWGGPFSISFGTPNAPGHIPRTVPLFTGELTRFQQELNDLVTQGSGEELMYMELDELGAAMDAYLGKGPDFIKYGGTVHFSYPDLILFSAAAQRVIVERTHARGLVAETHATSTEGLRQAIEAGVDLIQHPEILRRDMPDSLIDRIREQRIVCSMLSNVITGDAWQRHRRQADVASQQLELEERRGLPTWDTTWSQKRRRFAVDADADSSRRNAERLISAGCVVTIGTDNQWGAAPEFRLAPKTDEQEPGLGTLRGLEGLVELGMSTSDAVVAATRNGAIACGAGEQLGTIEAGKLADLLILDADPLQDISNVRRLSSVVSRGVLVDTGRLGTAHVFARS